MGKKGTWDASRDAVMMGRHRSAKTAVKDKLRSGTGRAPFQPCSSQLTSTSEGPAEAVAPYRTLKSEALETAGRGTALASGFLFSH